MKEKNVTIIGLNFYPESTAIGLYSTQLAQFLEEKGAIINVITAFPYYPQWEIDPAYKNKSRYLAEKLGSIELFRYRQYTPKKPTFIKRVLHIIDFTIGSYFNLRKVKKCDYVISIVPFTSSAYLGNILKRRFKAKHWIHIQDFEFDAAFQSGLVEANKRKSGWVHGLLMKLERRIFSKADRVSTISHSMEAKLKNKTTSTTYFLPNWIDQKDTDPETSKQHPYLTSEKTKLLYSGNIGDKQNWDFFFELVKKLDFNRFEIVLVGDGARRRQIKQQIAPYSGISLYPPVPYDELSDLLCSADVHFLFQKMEVIDTVMPSKILGMMASARPSIITGHADSEVNSVIKESNAGFYIAENSIEQVIQRLNDLHMDNEKANQIGKSARDYAIVNFAKRPILNRFVEELIQLSHQNHSS